MSRYGWTQIKIENKNLEFKLMKNINKHVPLHVRLSNAWFVLTNPYIVGVILSLDIEKRENKEKIRELKEKRKRLVDNYIIKYGIDPLKKD